MKIYFASIEADQAIKAIHTYKDDQPPPQSDIDTHGLLPVANWPLAQPRPSQAHILRLNGDQVSWHDPRTVNQHKTNKNSEINSERIRREQDGFRYGGKLIATDSISRRNLDATANVVARTGSLPASWPGGWKAVDNTLVPIPDVATWDAFYLAMYEASLAHYIKAQSLKNQLETAQTIGDVTGIVWTD